MIQRLELTRVQGVVLSVTSLIMAMAQDDLDAFAVCYQKAVDRLNRVSQSSSAKLGEKHKTLR